MKSGNFKSRFEKRAFLLLEEATAPRRMKKEYAEGICKTYIFYNAKNGYKNLLL